jgi:thymidylate synthase
MRYYITERHEAHIYDYNVRKINIVTSEDQSETRKLITRKTDSNLFLTYCPNV